VAIVARDGGGPRLRAQILVYPATDLAMTGDYYGRFTELWREADPEFQPKVKEVRLRIADLKAEPRRP